MPSETTDAGQRPFGHAPDAPGRTALGVVSAAFVLVAAGLALVSSRGPVAALVGLGAASFVLLLAIAGRERTAMLTMLGAFATAPMYKGLAPSPETPVTPTDLLFGLSLVLLVPTLIRRKAELPLSYVLGVMIILVTGTLSTTVSPEPVVSAIQFVQWLVVLVGLVGLIAMWAPSWRVVDALVWGYCIGQVASVAYSPFDGGVADRRIGLSHHPNAFGEAGVMAFAAALYLWRLNNALWYRAAVAVVAVAGAVSAVTSGSRAATVVIAGLVVMIPLVERSAVKGFALALVAAIFVIALPLVIELTGDSSALSRLAGSADALVADQARLDAQQLGIDRFFDHPIVGSGFDQAIYVHNIVLGVASSVGMIGLIGYLMVLYTFARPIIGRHPRRRLCYLAWAFIAITPTVPGLEDRTLWVPMALVILVAIEDRAQKLRAESPPGAADSPVPGLPRPRTATVVREPR